MRHVGYELPAQLRHGPLGLQILDGEEPPSGFRSSPDRGNRNLVIAAPADVERDVPAHRGPALSRLSGDLLEDGLARGGEADLRARWAPRTHDLPEAVVRVADGEVRRQERDPLAQVGEDRFTPITLGLKFGELGRKPLGHRVQDAAERGQLVV